MFLSKKRLSTIFIVLISTFVVCIPTIEAKEREYVKSSSVVFVDGRMVDYPEKPIVKEGTTLVPFRETFEAMGATVVWDQTERTVYASKGNKVIKLVIGSSNAQINGITSNLLASPILYKNKTMIPLRFVGEAYDGIVHYDTNNKKINITMPKYETDFFNKEQGSIQNIKNVENVELFGNRRLLVSDNPEVLSFNTINDDNVTLANDIVNINNSSIDHRVFGWHINKLDEEVIVGITIENISETSFKVDNLKAVKKIGSNSFYDLDIGLPISEALLGNRLTGVGLYNNTVNSGETILLGSFELKPNEIVGFINDFTVNRITGSGELNYIIRTVVSRDGSDLTQIKTSPVEADHINSHPRGVWPSSELMATLPTYDVNQGEEVSYNISNGKTDNLFSSTNSLVDSSISNKGHFGVVYTVKIPYKNDLNEEKTIRVRIGSRGGQYTGTVKTIDGIYNIPILDPMNDVVTVIDYKTPNSQDFIELSIVHAGGSSLPIAINLSTLD